MTTEQASPRHRPPRQNPVVKLVLEMGPLVVFFAATLKPQWFEPFIKPILPARILADEHVGIFIGTTVLMIAVVASLIASLALTRHVPTMPLITVFFALAMGGLTLYFQDAIFIKLKPTIVNTLFGVILLGALAFGKTLLPIVLDSVLELTEEGWRKLTVRWGLFFFFLAIVNEVVWRNSSDAFWAGFKSFGIMPLTVAFALAQVPLILKYEVKREEAGEA